MDIKKGEHRAEIDASARRKLNEGLWKGKSQHIVAVSFILTAKYMPKCENEDGILLFSALVSQLA